VFYGLVAAMHGQRQRQPCPHIHALGGGQRDSAGDGSMLPGSRNGSRLAVLGRESMETVTWRLAATYPDAPLEYVRRERYPETYALYQERITQEGVDEQFTLRGCTARYCYYYAGDRYKR